MIFSVLKWIVDVNVHIRLFCEVSLLILSALRSRALWLHSETKFGEFGLLLLKTLFSPLDASVLEPNFNLELEEKKNV